MGAQAHLAEMARAHGTRMLELNPEPTELTRGFDEARHDPVTEIISAWVEDLLLKD